MCLYKKWKQVQQNTTRNKVKKVKMTNWEKLFLAVYKRAPINNNKKYQVLE